MIREGRLHWRRMWLPVLALAMCDVVSAEQVDDIAARFAVCAACHGGDGRSPTMPQYPKIGGQNEAYLVSALKAYRAGLRQGGLAPLMTEVAKPLSDTEINTLARHVSRLPFDQVPR